MYLSGEGGNVNKKGALTWLQKISKNNSDLSGRDKNWWDKYGNNIMKDLKQKKTDLIEQ